MKFYTKTFVETRWYRRPPDAASTEWVEIPTEAVTLDTQIRNWVDQTGTEIAHPGQLGMHHEWHENMTLKAIILGLTVLYQVPDS